MIVNVEATQQDPSMRITHQERIWALEIREAVEESTALDNMTDMDYAQYSIITQGNLQEALRRIHAVQVFQKLVH